MIIQNNWSLSIIKCTFWDHRNAPYFLEPFCIGWIGYLHQIFWVGCLSVDETGIFTPGRDWLVVYTQFSCIGRVHRIEVCWS